MANPGIEPFKFDRSSSSIEWRRWKVKLASYLASSRLNLNDPDHIVLATETLKAVGDVLDVLLGSPNYDQLDYTQILKLYDARFDYTNPKIDLYKFHNTRFQPGDRLVDWIAKLRPLALAAGNGDDEQILNKIIICTSTPDKIRSKAMEPKQSLKTLLEWQNMKEMKIKFEDEIANQTTSLNAIFNNSRRYSASESSGSKQFQHKRSASSRPNQQAKPNTYWREKRKKINK